MTCLHPEGSTNSGYNKVNCYWDHPGVYNGAIRICDRPDAEDEQKRADELQRKRRSDEDTEK